MSRARTSLRQAKIRAENWDDHVLPLPDEAFVIIGSAVHCRHGDEK